MLDRLKWMLYATAWRPELHPQMFVRTRNRTLRSARRLRKEAARQECAQRVAEQRREEQLWRQGGVKPSWLQPHGSATNVRGERWSRRKNRWVPK